MATTNEVLAHLSLHVPVWMQPLQPHLAGFAAMLARATELNDDARDAASLASMEGIWLSLYAQGMGRPRQAGESDEDLRDRVRNVEDAVTRTAILSAVNAILAPYTATEAIMYEHWEEGFHADVDFADQPDQDIRIYDAHNGFTLLVPALSVDAPPSHGHFALSEADSGDSGAAYVDGGTYLVGPISEGTEHPVYAAIQAEVERLRAAGVRWWLLRDEP